MLFFYSGRFNRKSVHERKSLISSFLQTLKDREVSSIKLTFKFKIKLTHLSSCHHLASVVISIHYLLAIRLLFIFPSSFQEELKRIKPNLIEMFLPSVVQTWLTGAIDVSDWVIF
jgi:hypothetical protein